MFRLPDWKTEIDFEARIAAMPAHANARGMFFQYLLDVLDPQVIKQLEPPRYIAFKSYPLRDYVILMQRACELAFPGVPTSQAVRQMGRMVYPSYSRTMTGTAVFAIAGRSYRRIIELCPRAYEIGMTPGKITVKEISDNHALVELRDIWNIPDFHQVGVWEGAQELCEVEGTVETHVRGIASVDFMVRWRPL